MSRYLCRINPFAALLAITACLTGFAHATDNYEYGPDEYVTVAKGIAPNGKWAITTHGGGEYGYDNFHVYLTNAITGKKVGPLEEVVETLDTGAPSFCAQWSPDSKRVAITYRISRHEPLKVVSYRIGNHRAYLITGPVDATDDQGQYYQSACSGSQPRNRIFGSSVKK